MEEKNSKKIPELKSENGKLKGGFSSLTPEQMSKILGGTNNSCSGPNDRCTNNIRCGGANNLCANVVSCGGLNNGCVHGVPAPVQF